MLNQPSKFDHKSQNLPNYKMNSAPSNRQDEAHLEWNIVDFFKKSFQLLKQNPKLFILGAALVVFSSGGSHLRSFNNFSNQLETEQDSEVQQNIEQMLEEPAPEFQLDEQESIDFALSQNGNIRQLASLGEVLGESLDPQIIHEANSSDFESTILAAFSRVPKWIYGVGTAELLAFILYAIFFGLIVSAWAQAAMIIGLQQADQVSEPNTWSLSAAAKQGFYHVQPMIWLNIFPWILIAVYFIAGMIGIGIVMALINLLSLSNLASALISSLIILPFFIWILIKIIRTILAIILGQFHLVFKGLRAKEAFELGRQTLKGNDWRVLSLMGAHFIFSLVLTLIIFTPLVSSIIGFVATNISAESVSELITNFNSSRMIAPGVALLITVLVNTLARAALAIILNANWYWAYQTLTLNGDNYDN